jgi:hypothetical protein
MGEIVVRGLILDDWTMEQTVLSYGWTQVCHGHGKHFPKRMLDIGAGHGVCGVKGCDRISIHYVDFKKKDMSKYIIGDRLRVIRGDKKDIGKIATVEEVLFSKGHHYYYLVGERLWWNEDYFELAEKKPEGNQLIFEGLNG